MLVSIENVKRRFTEIICVNFEGKHKGDTICINDMAWDTTSGSRIGPQSSVPELSSINIPMMTMKRLTMHRNQEQHRNSFNKRKRNDLER